MTQSVRTFWFHGQIPKLWPFNGKPSSSTLLRWFFCRFYPGCNFGKINFDNLDLALWGAIYGKPLLYFLCKCRAVSLWVCIIFFGIKTSSGFGHKVVFPTHNRSNHLPVIYINTAIITTLHIISYPYHVLTGRVLLFWLWWWWWWRWWWWWWW